MNKLISLLLLGLSFQIAHAAIKDVDRVVAIVNSDVITLSELNNRVKEVNSRLANQQNKPSLADIRKQVFNLMVEEQILIQYAKETGVRVSTEELDQAVDNIAKQNKVSVSEFYQQLEKKEGISASQVRKTIGDGLLIEKVKQREIGSRITVTDNEVNQELGSSQTAAQGEQIRLAAILIATPENANDAVLNQKSTIAEEAMKALKSGQSFANVAKKYSDLSNKSSGGDMGYQVTNRLPADLTKMLSALQVGQYTEIIHTPEGFYIFQLTDRKSAAHASGQSVKRYHVQHILIKVNDLTSDGQAQTKIKEIQTKLQQGENFNALAKQYSEDGSAIQGGDIGWVGAGDTVPEFEESMTKLALNQVSEPVRTSFGYHLIKVIDEKEEDMREAQAKAQIRQKIAERKGEQIYKEWIAQLVAGAHIVNKLNEE
ncbi:peptidylprolyl isomerase [Neisseria sp. Ec49-e6-T10]|uniref:peptidylprolyl isomerase n=1 Tax=Neisseria sp. Ec49-e6-T10 TaxID=3140744 RepID=UPI003EB8CCD3